MTSPPSGKFKVVYSGRIVERQKRISLVTQALIMACKQYEKIEAVLMGNGPELESVVDQFAEAGLAHRISCKGYLKLRTSSKRTARCSSNPLDVRF